MFIFSVDWAALAKQWIAQKDSVPSVPQNDMPVHAPIHGGPPIQSAPPPPPPPEGQGNFQGDNMEIVNEDNEHRSG